MTFSSRAVAVAAFIAGVGLAGAAAYGVGQSVQTGSAGAGEDGGTDTVKTVDYGSN
ncbi:MAG: hypothetical protein QM597_05675 [Aeromicrobium sp.]|uniref:hypothetical protein n=1 Tax=Aeromicrobium sp. TaxID=1871063 RepID=UPI0039E2FB79